MPTSEFLRIRLHATFARADDKKPATEFSRIRRRAGPSQPRGIRRLIRVSMERKESQLDSESQAADRADGSGLLSLFAAETLNGCSKPL
ncbi:MAG: hypothetical protein DWI22_09690 [Planctomycetota bacterium]|nr:MAG: hypothetical protein DWI22_09690 [Planctomycetota bacterium]